ncbi:MAG TPA: lipopolysaccharide assembly protein LapA domain-containing protein [Pseudonocardiaceae bacterium]
MVDHEHRIDAPDTDPIPVQSATQPTHPPAPPQQVRRTRISGLWVGVTVAAVVLLNLLVFIIQNGQSVTISIFGGSMHLPLGVALLLAAILGVLLVAIPGYGRIIQLRRAIRRAGSN